MSPPASRVDPARPPTPPECAWGPRACPWNGRFHADTSGMEPITQDITLHRGASYRRRWTFALPGATEENGWEPRRDFTGCEARAEVRLRAGEETVMVSINEVESDDGQITLGGDEGTIDVYISPVGTLKLTGRRAAWDLFVEWPSGIDVDKVLMGEVTIDPNVTDPSYD